MTFSYQATVNYPDDEQDTPKFTGYSIDGVCTLMRSLLEQEGKELTSAVITIVREAKP